MSGDVRSEVIEAVRASLPEFCKRNGLDIPETRLDNLAQWVVNAFPSGVYREFCPGVRAVESGEVEEYACACPGTCWFWHRVPLDAADAIRDQERERR